MSVGNLPPGHTIDAATGIISGISITVEDFDFTVNVNDSTSPTSFTDS